MDTIKDIDLSVPGAPSLVMRDLSEYSTLPFLAAFDVISPSSSTGPGSSTSTPPKRVTYISLAKKTMPLLVELYQRFKDTPAIYIDGTVEAVLSVRFFLPLIMDLRSSVWRAVVLDTYKTQVRVPCSVQVWERSSSLEDCDVVLLVDYQRMYAADTSLGLWYVSYVLGLQQRGSNLTCRSFGREPRRTLAANPGRVQRRFIGRLVCALSMIQHTTTRLHSLALLPKRFHWKCKKPKKTLTWPSLRLLRLMLCRTWVTPVFRMAWWRN